MSQITLDNIAYLPTLFLRASEMRALEQLSDTDKDQIIPLIPVRPWATSKTIEKGVERIEKAFPNRKYIIDVDHYYGRSGDKPAQQQFRSLKSKAEEYDAWFQFVTEFENAIPCIQFDHDSNEGSILTQIERADRMDRGFVIRIELHRHAAIIPQLVAAIRRIEHTNFLVVVDVGWGQDILSRAVWASSWIDQITVEGRRLRAVVSGSSFPSGFTSYGSYGTEQLQEKPLHATLQRNHNATTIIYGDWGSVRPPIPQSGGGNAPPRIDLASVREWSFYRGRDVNSQYSEIAQRAVNSSEWVDDLSVWGRYFIHNTAVGVGDTINSAQQSTAARVNIHLHEQIRAIYQLPSGQVEEDFVD